MRYQPVTWVAACGLLVAGSAAAVAGPPAPPAAEETSCEPEASRLLILGTYHMANPGLDEVNVEADDVRSPRRRAELAELLDRLESFRPTRVAIESAHDDATWPERYAAFRRGEYEPGRNEIDAIALPLAARLDLDTVHPVDFPMWMSGLRPDEIDWERLRAPAPAETEAEDAAPPVLSEAQERLLSSTILDYLLWLNSPARIRQDHRQYMDLLAPGDGVAIYERSDRLANWYRRNLRIMTNVHRIAGDGPERILLLIGSGHLKILRDLAADSPAFCLVDTAAVLRGAGPAQTVRPGRRASETIEAYDGPAIAMSPKLYRVILPVPDVDAAAAFYAGLFGQPGERVSPGRHYLDLGGTILALYDPGADGDDPGDGWRPHENQYLYVAVGDLEAASERAAAAGATLLGEIAEMPWGERLVYLRDPFGNPICLVDERTVFVGGTSG